MKTMMKAIFGLGTDKAQEGKARAASRDARQEESYSALIDAATSTLTMAQDVTTGLRDRLDDYTAQIDATSKVIPDALLVVNDDGVIENVNAAAERIFDYDKDFMIGMTLSKLFSNMGKGEISLSRFKKTYKYHTNIFEQIRSGKFETRGVRSDGSQFYPNIKVSKFDHSNGTQKFMLLVQDVTDIVVSERSLMSVFEQQTATLAALPDILIIVSRNCRVQKVMNSSPHDFLFTEDHNGKYLSDILSEENYHIFSSYCAGIDESSTEAWNFQVHNDNGSTTHYEARASMCGDDILIIIRDETDVVVTREELLESEEHFRMFGQASNEAMMIHNDDHVLDWNPRLSEMTGFSAVEIKNMHALEFVHPMERARMQLTTTSAAYTTLFHTKNGGSIEVAINERMIEWKNQPARIKVIRDITHLKDIDNILHLSRERYKSLTDNTFDVVACFGIDMKLTFVNQTFKDYFATTMRPDMTLLEVVDQRDHARLRAHLGEISFTHPVKRTLHRVSFNGQTRWLDWIDRAVYTDSGRFVEFQGVGRDVTDYIKRAKESNVPTSLQA